MSVRKTLASAILTGTLFALAACGGSGQREKNGEPVLRVGDQLGMVKATLDSAGEGQPKGYSIEWSNFTSGPLIIAAQTGGSVDLGWMAETPLIFAQAAGSPVKVVAVNRPSAKPDGQTGYPYALVVLPQSPIRSVAQLKGKSVAYRTGTVLHYMVARQLADAGLSLKDIKSLEVTSYDTSLLEKGAADAQTLNEPFLTKLVDAGKVRVLAQGGPPVTPGLNYLVASDAALADPKRAKATGEFITRLARANQWQNAHPAEAAGALSKVYHTDPRTAQKIIERTPQEYAPIDASIIAAHQTEADLFHNQGLIRKPLDAKRIFDTRFNTLVAPTETRP